MDDSLTMLFRCILAGVLSCVIGFEREIKENYTVLRTHFLVGLGACSFMLLSEFGLIENNNFNPTQIPAYVISGMGFLGAGTIIQQGTNVKGLTTAASLWVVTGIGLLVGVGMENLALTVTLITIISLWVLKKIEKKLRK